MRFPCWLVGHCQMYVGVEDIVWVGEFGELERPCVHNRPWLKCCDICGKSIQIARWYCPCGVMGETFIPKGKGLFRVEFGRLVPDEKRWANHLGVVPKEK
jgi:hypothetical protein